MNNTIENTSAAEFSIERVTAAIEAILYAAGHPVEYARLSEVLGLTQKDTISIIEAMSAEYNGENSPRGVLLLMYPDSCQFATKEEFLPYIREALCIKRGGNLSNSTMETLAVVAYNQPVTRAFVDAVRGVDSSYAMTSLVDKNLIESLSRLDAPGRPMLYTTTEKFLRVFGLSSLDELPKTELSPTTINAEQLAIEEIGFSSAVNIAEAEQGAEPQKADDSKSHQEE